VGARIMPLKHIRYCDHCQLVRYAPCAATCRVPNDEDPRSWQPTQQEPEEPEPVRPRLELVR
jgi:hypothetical protein